MNDEIRRGAQVVVAFTRLDDRGSAVGDLGDRQIHVRGALPEEEARVAIEHVSLHGGHVWGRLEQLLRASPARRPAPCPHATVCGGCPLMHASPEAQLEAKRERVRRALASHPELAAVEVAAVRRAPRLLGYRNSAKFVVAREGRRLVLGSYQPASHRVADMDGCPVLEAPLPEMARTVVRQCQRLGVQPFDEQRLEGELRYVTMRRSHRGEVLLTLVTARPDFPLGMDLATSLRAAHPEAVGVLHDVNSARSSRVLGEMTSLLAGRERIAEAAGAVDVALDAHAFRQVNREQAERLYEQVVELTEGTIGPGRLVLDLYCGAGAIALRLAARLAGRGRAQVLGIDSSPASIRAATEAAERAGLGRVCCFISSDVAPALAAWPPPGLAAGAAIPPVAVAVLDPPRQGCGPEVTRALIDLGPRRIVMVSCSPATLARDLVPLVAAGYRPGAVGCFDLFPQTAHVECVLSLDGGS